MRFAITSEQKSFYKRSGYIEFESLLSKEQLSAFREEIESALAKRLQGKEKQVWNYYLAGRDLWRESDSVRKISLSRKYAEIAASLLGEPSLQIAYDQCIKTPSKPSLSLEERDHFTKKLNLQRMSSFSPVACGMLLHISDDIDEADTLSLSLREDLEVLVPLPKNPGSAVFFGAHLPLDLLPMLEIPRGLYLLVAYSTPPTVYVLEENDIHTHELKKWGYSFGDRLSFKTHPQVHS